MILGRGSEAGGSGDNFEIKILTLNEFMKILMQEGKGALTTVSGVMSGTFSPYQGPPQGTGGYPAPPNPGAR